MEPSAVLRVWHPQTWCISAACDARMAGAMIPVMSNSGSGNQGIAATLPVVVYADETAADEEHTIRALVLLPYLLSCLMDRRYMGVILCILAEACMVWTLYGAGVCLLVTVAWLILGALVSQFRKRWEKRKMTDAHGRSGEEATE